MAKPSKQSKLKDTKTLVQTMNGNSYNPQEDLLELLKSRCPEVFTEGKIDPKKLRQTLGEEVSEEGERYGLSWAGKSDCFRHIQEPTTATLNPVKEESVNFDATENIFIEGDNLQALKVLQKSYYGKIKMIYIDPPYNTGNDSFIYPDRFAESQEDYLKRIGDKDVEGNLIRDVLFRKNTKDTGHFHSNWLTMMYPRLFLSRNLLRPDGVIFVSIDDNEVQNLRMVMNEIFDEQNFIEQIVLKNKAGAGAKPKGFITVHEYILCYAKNADRIGEIATPYSEKLLKLYNKKDENFERRGPYGTWALSTTSMDDRPHLRFPIYYEGEEIWPEKQWLWTRERVEEALKKNELVFNRKNDGSWSVRFKRYLKDEEGNIRLGTPTSFLDGPYTHEGTKELDQLFETRIYDFPKPSGLIKKLFQLRLNQEDGREDIFLDFFAGSCTTAQAVMELNREDGGNRKFICVQLAEPCEEDSEAYKAGYKTIVEIGKERIRRAARKIAKDSEGKLKFDKSKLDLGFKVFKLSESNFKIWRSDVKTPKQLEKQMGLFVDNVKSESTQENILYELILKSGLDLNVPIEKKKQNGKKYFAIDEGKLIICLEDKITQKLINTILKAKAEKVICLDKAFAGNDPLKTNTALQMQSEKIDFKVI